MMNEDDRKILRRLLRKSKDIRNAMAHHNIRTDARLHDLENVKERLSDMLEFAIRGAASDRGIYQVPWCPYYHICKTYVEKKGPLIVMVPLNEESLLSFRDRVFRDHNLEQKEVLYRRVKRKATEEGRQKQKDDYESALIRKQQRKERDIAMRSKHQFEKLGRIHQRFIYSQELGYTRLNKVKLWMKGEQEIFYRQRAEVLKDGIFHLTAEEELLARRSG
ncbi:hypothetical protein N7523_009359 [Penicillium sp. IBT 18751x]|nr:hypothetical protein N7523_009359 [Penicillium sp. IBT 18751x]